MQELKAHPAADLFPMLDEKRLQELAEDISQAGQREAIRLFDGMILDGRNRYAACKKMGIEPRFEQVDPSIDPFAYVWSLNGERRDLTADQRYLIWKRVNENSDAWKAEQKRIRDAGNKARSESAIGVPYAPKGGHRKAEKVVPQVVEPPSRKKKTNEAKATASKTNRGAVERMDALDKHRPDLAEKVFLGELPAAAAIRQMKQDQVVENLEDIATKQAKEAEGVYDVIVLDPPWKMEKIERDVAPNQVGFDYPTMSEDELAQMEIPCADDCHVFLWTTHKHLPMAMRLLDAWRMKYVCTFVWHKPGGFQPFGLPQYNCEFALYARRGTPQFVDFKNFPVCFNAPRGAHSEKPEDFYEMLRRVTAGRRLDMFNRRVIDGFDRWGNEV